MDDDAIAEVNQSLLNHKGPTDVITVRYAAIPGEAATDAFAELYVNVERAVQLAHRNWSAGRELALYLAHGCDHLSGEDDQTPTARQRMRRRELNWLRQCERAGHDFDAMVESEEVIVELDNHVR